MENKMIFKSLFTVIVGIMLIFAVQPIYDSFADKPSDKGKANAKVSIPENAIKVAPGVYKLGEGVSQGKIVQGFMFIDYEKGFGHNPKAPPNHGGEKGGGGNGDDKTKCFAYLKKDTKWKVTPEPWFVNPANARDVLGDNFVLTKLSNSIQKWEDASSTDILGSGTITTDILVADTALPIDNVNEVYFADISTSGAIAVTITWYETRGPPQNRDIVEWDQIYDDVDFDWSSTGEAGKMDFANIATHELGHALGLSHPNDTCTLETMYAFAEDGETIKRDLHDGDIAGVNEMYS